MLILMVFAWVMLYPGCTTSEEAGQYTLTVRVLTPNLCNYIIRYRDVTDLFGSG